MNMNRLLYSICFVAGIWLMVMGLGTYIHRFAVMSVDQDLTVAVLFAGNVWIVYLLESFK